tara:strand:- start:102 stop:542 length:441 start_codon:yes stop_codon:yes gene_type:complete
MKYAKHYWVKCDSNTVSNTPTSWLTTTNDAPNGKTHPFGVPNNPLSTANVDVKIWLTDSDGIDVCLSEVSDSVTITEVAVGTKKALVELTETQFNSVKTPYDAAAVLRSEAFDLRNQETPDETAAAAKDTEADAKLSEAKTALNAL